MLGPAQLGGRDDDVAGFDATASLDVRRRATRTRRRPESGDRPDDRRDGAVGADAVDRLGASNSSDRLAGQVRRLVGREVQAAILGGAADPGVHQLNHLRVIRLHLGRQLAHRQRPRSRAAGQSRALLHHHRPVRGVRRGNVGRRAAVRQARSGAGAHHQQLARARGRRADGRRAGSTRSSGSLSTTSGTASSGRMSRSGAQRI